MKPLVSLFVAASSISLDLASMAQSTFQFRNLNPPVGIDAPVYDAGGNRLAGTNYAAELWGGAANDSLFPTLDLGSGQRVGLSFLTGAGAGYFTSVKEMTVWQVPPGIPAWLQVRAWDVRLGTTYDDVMALGIGGYGESSLLYLVGGDPLAVPPSTPRPLIGLQSFSLRAVVPEPSTWALLAVGGIVLGWAARRGCKLP
jgi:hypothetical protein